jgi:hypothetical protein
MMPDLHSYRIEIERQERHWREALETLAGVGDVTFVVDRAALDEIDAACQLRRLPVDLGRRA